MRAKIKGGQPDQLRAEPQMRHAVEPQPARPGQASIKGGETESAPQVNAVEDAKGEDRIWFLCDRGWKRYRASVQLPRGWSVSLQVNGPFTNRIHPDPVLPRDTHYRCNFERSSGGDTHSRL